MNHYELEACVIRAKNGNKEELLKILEQYRPFIIKTAKNYNIKNYDFYDLVQAGYVSLINAVAKYRAGSTTFSTYGLNAVSNGLRYITRQNNRYNEEMSLNVPLNTEINSNAEFIDFLEDTENIEMDLLNREQVIELKKIVSKLSADEMELVVMVYYTGIPLKTYAEKSGINYQQVLRRKKRIMEKLRRYIKEY